jgi:hypothetical protein
MRDFVFVVGIDRKKVGIKSTHDHHQHDLNDDFSISLSNSSFSNFIVGEKIESSSLRGSKIILIKAHLIFYCYCILLLHSNQIVTSLRRLQLGGKFWSFFFKFHLLLIKSLDMLFSLVKDIQLNNIKVSDNF